MANVNVEKARVNALVLLLELRTLTAAVEQAYGDLAKGDLDAAIAVLEHYEGRLEAADLALTDGILGNLDFYEGEEG